MSGQPVKTHADENRFRNEYMETLALQAAINDMNLQANKTYLLTGQLPPSSQMQDTRTNAEKLADVEQMKRDIAEGLRPIAEPQFGYAIVNAIIDSPLNLNGSLLRFLAQRVDTIVDNLRKVIKIGIKGDANDLEQIVSYIKDMYAKQQGSFQSVKSYMNSTTSDLGSTKIISANDINFISLQIQDIIKNLIILGAEGNEYKVKLTHLIRGLKDLRKVLPTNEQLQIFLDIYTGLIETTSIDAKYLKTFFDMMKNLPKYNQVMALTEKIKSFMMTNNKKLSLEGINGLYTMFADVIIGMEDVDIYDNMVTIKNALDAYQQAGYNQGTPSTSRTSDIYEFEAPQQIPSQPQTFALETSTTPETYSAPEITRVRSNEFEDLVERMKSLSLKDLDYVCFGFINSRGKSKEEVINMIKQALISYEDEDDDMSIKIITERINERYDAIKGIKEGKGLIKRRGRPRGSGIAKVEKPPTFVGFGINEINQRKLKDGILKIRRNTRTSFQDMPSKRISPTLQRIIKTVVGGGMPNFNDLSSLDEQEKEYLHKIVTRSNMEDKLSIPAPSKDQREKDIHNFEVMKGQIMSGNDSIELVKKFKLLIRKLSKQGLLPKNDVEDIMEALIDLGY